MADDSEYARQLPNEPLNPGRILPQSLKELKDHTATWVSIVDREAHTRMGVGKRHASQVQRSSQRETRSYKPGSQPVPHACYCTRVVGD